MEKGPYIFSWGHLKVLSFAWRIVLLFESIDNTNLNPFTEHNLILWALSTRGSRGQRAGPDQHVVLFGSDSIVIELYD